MKNNYIEDIKLVKNITDKLYNIDDYFKEFAITQTFSYQNKLAGCIPCRGIIPLKPLELVTFLSADEIPFNLFMNLNSSFFILTIFMVLIAIIAFFIPKTPKGISILNVLSAFIMLIFLITLPIPNQNTTFAPITGLEYTPFVYLFAICSGIHLISFLAVNNTVTFTRDNNQIEYPLLMVLLFFTSFILVAATNWLIILISLEAITFIVAVLVAFQRNHSLTPSVAIRYILFSAIPSGILILGISEFYVYFGTFNLFDLEKLQLVSNIDSSTVPIQNIKESIDSYLFKTIYMDIIYNDKLFYYDTIMGHHSRAHLIDKLERGSEFIEMSQNLSKTNPILDLIIKRLTGWEIFTANVTVFNETTEKFVFGPDKKVVDLNFLLNDMKTFSILAPPQDTYETLVLAFYNEHVYNNDNPHVLHTSSKDLLNNFKSIYYKGEATPANVWEEIDREHKAIDQYCLDRGYNNKDREFSQKLVLLRDYVQVFDELYPTIAVYSNSEGIPASYTVPKDACNTLSHWNLLYYDVNGNLQRLHLRDLHVRGAFALYDLMFTIDYNQQELFNGISLVSLNHNYETPIIITVALLMVMFNILFKLTAAPFHFWAPIVYEGAPLPITMFLSIFTKIVMIFLLIKVIIYTIPLYDTAWVNLLLFSGVLSIIVGIFGAISETRIKRFFVYSSMGHVGFMLLGLVEGGVHGITASLMYLIIYIFSAFILWLILLTSVKPINYLTQFSGLSNTNPAISLILSLTLLSMSGIPPLAGFYVKFEILYVLASSGYYGIAFITLLLTIISFFYYLRLIKILYFEPTKKYTIQFNFNRLQANILVSFFFLVAGYSFYVQGSSYFYLKSIVQTLF